MEISVCIRKWLKKRAFERRFWCLFLDALASLDFKLWVGQLLTVFTASASTGLSDFFALQLLCGFVILSGWGGVGNPTLPPHLLLRRARGYRIKQIFWPFFRHFRPFPEDFFWLNWGFNISDCKPNFTQNCCVWERGRCLSQTTQKKEMSKEPPSAERRHLEFGFQLPWENWH